MQGREKHNDYDAIIIGAGVCGIYMLHKLLGMGMKAIVIEAAERPGGTWNKNRYPGARFDSESYTYAYSFSEEIMQEWNWSEHFAGQAETLRYLTYVVDKLGVREHMRFNSRVTHAHYQENEKNWQVKIENDETISAKYLCTAIGLLSAPTKPRYEGVADFKGASFHTYDWPEDLNIKDKKVAVIGTGATGVQVISTIASDVESLTVFQRRPNWCAPLNNSKIKDEDQAALKANYPEILEKVKSTPGGFVHGPKMFASGSVPEEERYAYWEELYNSPGFGIWLSNYVDVLIDEKANQEFSDFIAKKIRSRVKNQKVAEKLIPKDHGFGTRRVPLETKYFEAYNNDNVELIDISENPIECITQSGIKTKEKDFDFDIIVYATGFDAVTGAFEYIDIRGKNNCTLKDKWKDGPQTYLGLQVNNFPNMFMLAGPQSASVGSNFPPAIQTIVDWACDLVKHIEDNDIDICEPSPEAETSWQEEVKAGYHLTLLGSSKSWFTGHNSNLDRDDKTRYLVYFKPAPKFREILKDIAENSYEGFQFTA